MMAGAQLFSLFIQSWTPEYRIMQPTSGWVFSLKPLKTPSQTHSPGDSKTHQVGINHQSE